MKVGDLVRYNTDNEKWAIGLRLVGLVVETGVRYTYVKIQWNDGHTNLHKSWQLEVINGG